MEQRHQEGTMIQEPLTNAFAVSSSPAASAKLPPTTAVVPTVFRETCQ